MLSRGWCSILLISFRHAINGDHQLLHQSKGLFIIAIHLRRFTLCLPPRPSPCRMARDHLCACQPLRPARHAPRCPVVLPFCPAPRWPGAAPQLAHDSPCRPVCYAETEPEQASRTGRRCSEQRRTSKGETKLVLLRSKRPLKTPCTKGFRPNYQLPNHPV